MKSVLAILPARGGSKRLPRKNILPVNNKPMIAHPIKACLDSGVFSYIVVSTDSEEIASIAREAGADVVMRPDHMATDTSHEFEAYRHVLETYQAKGIIPDFFCGIYPTAVMITGDDLKGGFEKISGSDADVVMSVSTFPLHPYKSLQENAEGYWEMVHPEWCKKRSQLYPRYVASNGTFYYLKTKSFASLPDYYAEKLVTYEMPFDRAVDIDTMEDYEFVNALMSIRK